jgi:hypothetical protein
MPGKGRRVASRQSQLGQRRRRNSKNLQSATNTGMSPVLDSSNVIPDEPRVVDVKSSVLGSRSRSNSTDGSSSDTYVRSEITRILILGSVLALALVVLSFLI